MPTDTSGKPANIANNLPSPLSIASTTNATPIVVTTATPHGLRPGDWIYITGAADPNANGLFIAGLTASTTQVQLKTAPAGANVAGSTAGGAAGTLLSLGFGLTFPIPNDATDKRSAATVNVAFEALADMTAYLMMRERYPSLRLIEVQAWSNADASETYASYNQWTSNVYGNGNGSGSNPIVLSMSCQAGDILEASFTGSLTNNLSTGELAAVRLAVNDGGAGAYVELSGARAKLFSTEPTARIALGGHRIISNAGSRILSVQAKSQFANDVDAIGPAALIVRHYRPN